MIRKEDVRALKLIHLAMCLGLGIFVLIVALVVKKGNGALIDLDKETAYILHTLVFLSFLLCVPLAYYLHSRNVKKLRLESNPMEGYRNSILTKLALIEGTGMFSGVFYLLTANNQILIVAAMALVLLAINRPNYDKMVQELDLEQPEQEKIEE